jgi:hypothetical protein
MKTLRSISTAVLLCLVLASPAAAATEPTISATVSTPSATLGTPVSYTVSGAGEPSQTYSVRIVSLATHAASECVHGNSNSQLVFQFGGSLGGSSVSLKSFSTTNEIPSSDYSTIGTYAVCSILQGGAKDTYSEPVTFAVVAPAPPVQPTPPPAPAVTPSVAPLAPPLAAPSVAASTSVQKLHAALAKCKKQKNKKKRAKCERAAKKVTR